MDAAANEFVARAWPAMRDSDQPLGYWVLAANFDPPLPPDSSFEEYMDLLIASLRQRLTEPPNRIYQLGRAALKNKRAAMQQALQTQPQAKDQEEKTQAKADQGQQSQQPGDQSDKDKGDDTDQTLSGLPAVSQQSQSGEPCDSQAGPGNQSQGNSDPGKGHGDTPAEMSPEQLQQEIDNLDALDQAVLNMLVSSMSAHMGWEAADNEDTEVEAEAHQLAEHGRAVIKATVKSQQKGRGTIPGQVMELIRKMLLPPTVPWTQFLQTIIQRTRQTKKERGMARPSKVLSAIKKFAELQTRKAKGTDEEEEVTRRFKHLRRVPNFPGTKHNNKYTMVYAVDTSGSMGCDELQRGLAELQHVQKSDSDVNVCVLYSDTRVCTEYWVGPSSEIDPSMTGRGGTDFDPVFRRVEELLRMPDKAPDILIYCTDGYAPPPSIRLPIPVVWLLTPRGRPVTRDAGHITIEMRDYQLGESH